MKEQLRFWGQVVAMLGAWVLLDVLFDTEAEPTNQRKESR